MSEFITQIQTGPDTFMLVPVSSESCGYCMAVECDKCLDDVVKASAEDATVSCCCNRMWKYAPVVWGDLPPTVTVTCHD